MTLDELESKELQLWMEEIACRAREGLLAFTKFTKPDYVVNWHHRLTCHYLNQFTRGEIKRLMIFEPPRHGKSELTSRRLPAFILGRDPKASIIATSYSADLASRMNRDVQRIIDSPEYRAIFPGVNLAAEKRNVTQGTWLRNSDLFEIVKHGGVYRSAGVGGGITGMGATHCIIDDPVKNQEEADSPVKREALWEWYQSTLYTRLEKDGAILLNMTRWHEDDLAGRLLKLARENAGVDQWTVLTLPAIREVEGHPDDPRAPGEPLWPGKFSLEALEKIKAVGPRVWNALYQQRPTALEGNIIKHEWWKYYREAPAFDEMIQSWDFAVKDTGDYTVGQVWGRKGSEKYLVDQVRGLFDFPTACQALVNLSAKWPNAHRKLVEDKANGPAVIAMLKRKVSGLVPVEPQGDKVARASAVSATIEAGNVYLPESRPWLHDFTTECADFPNSSHDDQVDAMTQALAYFAKKEGTDLESLLQW